MMLRTLLADRFKLVMHKETKELPIFELVLARQDGRLGPQLRPAAVDCAARAAAARAGTPPPASSGPPGPGSCGITMNPVSVRGGGATMAMLASLLEGPAQRLVIDRTGLTGNWDLEVNYTPDRSQVPPGRRAAVVDRSERPVAVHRARGAARAEAPSRARAGRSARHRLGSAAHAELN